MPLRVLVPLPMPRQLRGALVCNARCIRCIFTPHYFTPQRPLLETGDAAKQNERFNSLLFSSSFSTVSLLSIFLNRWAFSTASQAFTIRINPSDLFCLIDNRNYKGKGTFTQQRYCMYKAVKQFTTLKLRNYGRGAPWCTLTRSLFQQPILIALAGLNE